MGFVQRVQAVSCRLCGVGCWSVDVDVRTWYIVHRPCMRCSAFCVCLVSFLLQKVCAGAFRFVARRAFYIVVGSHSAVSMGRWGGNRSCYRLRKPCSYIPFLVDGTLNSAVVSTFCRVPRVRGDFVMSVWRSLCHVRRQHGNWQR